MYWKQLIQVRAKQHTTTKKKYALNLRYKNMDTRFVNKKKQKQNVKIQKPKSKLKAFEWKQVRLYTCRVESFCVLCKIYNHPRSIRCCRFDCVFLCLWIVNIHSILWTETQSEIFFFGPQRFLFFPFKQIVY